MAFATIPADAPHHSSDPKRYARYAERKEGNHG